VQLLCNQNFQRIVTPMYAHRQRQRWGVLRMCDPPTRRPEVVKPQHKRASIGTNRTGVVDNFPLTRNPVIDGCASKIGPLQAI
jgi:hypothetical protein